MLKLHGKKRSAFSSDELAALEKHSADYWEKSRSLESETIKDLEKHLWLANGAAATVSVGFVQAATTVPISQYVGACAFVGGILALILMKFVSAANSLRDRYRFQDAKHRFDTELVTDHVFESVRDRVFDWGKRAYLMLQWTSGIAFVTGLILTLVGVRNAA